MDIVITEGYKTQDKPKIEVFRSEVHDKPVCTDEDNRIALVSDKRLELDVPRFSLDDIRGLVHFVEHTVLTAHS
jgi:molybdopterin-guanine dinucleotide biosynthesis protein B